MVQILLLEANKIVSLVNLLGEALKIRFVPRFLKNLEIFSGKFFKVDFTIYLLITSTPKIKNFRYSNLRHWPGLKRLFASHEKPTGSGLNFH